MEIGYIDANKETHVRQEQGEKIMETRRVLTVEVKVIGKNAREREETNIQVRWNCAILIISGGSFVWRGSKKARGGKWKNIFTQAHE